MRTSLNIDDELLEKAAKLTGIREKNALIKCSLESLIAIECAKRLAQRGGTEKGPKTILRRRTAGR